MHQRSFVLIIINATAVLGAMQMVGCASAPLYIGTGAMAGAAIGGVTGYYASGQRSKETAIGTAIGTASGGLLGYLIYYLVKKKTDSSKLAEPVGPPLDPAQVPQVTKPDVGTMWVPPKIEGDRYIEGHRVFILERKSEWTKE